MPVKMPEFSTQSNALVKKYLSEERYQHLHNIKTSSGYTLDQAIRSGVENADSSIGIYAGDAESYDVFSSVFNDVIEEYHGFSGHMEHKSDLKVKSLNTPFFSDLDRYIVSTRIRVGRNLLGFPLGAGMTRQQRVEVEKKIVSTLQNLDGEFAGEYYPLSGMSPKTQDRLIEDHFLFKEGDRFLESAGLNRGWPEGRGIFHNRSKNFLVWVNEEDELRIISMQEGGGILVVFERLVKALSLLEKNLSFIFDKKLGYITSCPSNLGTAMRASVHIKLPKLSKKHEDFKALADKFHLQIRGTHGEHSESEGGIYDISNKRRLGLTEVECVQGLYDGVKAMIEKEKELS